MARRSDHSREELYVMALAAAREIAEKDGLRGLKARRISREIGYTVGTLYNVFSNLDDLIIHLNGTTLDALYESCAQAPPLEDEPEAALRTLARAYIRFTSSHPNLWGMLFEPTAPHGEKLPDWYHEKVRALFGLAEQALASFFPDGQEEQRRHSARVLWSGLHGICSLARAGALAKSESETTMADSLITNYVAGLRQAAP
jgi:AcrR family transcriptional regulator